MHAHATFVGRQPEITRLESLLRASLAANGQVCFVAGEPGAGKSALVQEFTRRAQEHHPELVIAAADCSGASAATDAYLPFREILALLTGDVDASLAEGAITAENATRLRSLVDRAGEVVAEYGIDLIDVFVPGTRLITRLGGTLAKRFGLVAKVNKDAGSAPTVGDPARVMQQFTNVVRKLAEARPLILLIDDAHWADRASIDLLFHLSRRIEGSRILLLATYRSNEISAVRDGERHPLESVINEIRRYYGDATIDLDRDELADRLTFVNQLIDAEPNALPQSFRDELVEHTHGHPLFTVELLQALRARGVVMRDESGTWRLVADVNWSVLPSRSEGIIAERIARAPADLRGLLDIAAVEGEQFTAQVVAQVAGSDASGVTQALSGVAERQHQLVRAQGVQKIGAQRVASYRFRHELFRAYLYEALDPVQRSELHFAVGRALEALHASALDEVAPALADHFERAGEPDDAIRYLNLAAEMASKRHAPRQAADLWRRALVCCDAATRPVVERSAILEKCGDALRYTGAFDEARSTLQDALGIADDPLSRARVLRKIGSCCADQHHLGDALDYLAQAESELPPHSDADTAAITERVQLLLDRAWALYWMNSPAEIERLVAEGDTYIEQYGTADDRARWLQARVHAGVRAQRYRPSDELAALATVQLEAAGTAQSNRYAHCAFLHGIVHLCRGDLTIAERSLTDALRTAEQHAHGLAVVLARTYMAVLLRMRGAVEAVPAAIDAADVAARESKMMTYVAAAQANRAWVHYRRGEVDRVEPLAREALDSWSNAAVQYPFRWLAAWPLAAVLSERGALPEAVAVLEGVLRPDQQVPPSGMEAEVHAARVALDGGETAAAQRHVERALDFARGAGEL